MGDAWNEDDDAAALATAAYKRENRDDLEDDDGEDGVDDDDDVSENKGNRKKRGSVCGERRAADLNSASQGARPGATSTPAAVVGASSSAYGQRRESASRSSTKVPRKVLKMGAASVSNIGGQPFRPGRIHGTGAKAGGSFGPGSRYSEDGDGVSPGLIDAMELPKDRLLVFKMEKNLTKFMSKKSARTMKFPPMTAHARRLLHLLCERFCLRSETIEASLDKRTYGDPRAPRPMMITKDYHSMLPGKQLIEIYGREASSGTGKQPKIMMRRRDPTIKRQSGGSSAAENRTKSKETVVGKTKSSEEKLREKEKKYAEARKRIFASHHSNIGGTMPQHASASTATPSTSTNDPSPSATKQRASSTNSQGFVPAGEALHSVRSTTVDNPDTICSDASLSNLIGKSDQSGFSSTQDSVDLGVDQNNLAGRKVKHVELVGDNARALSIPSSQQHSSLFGLVGESDDDASLINGGKVQPKGATTERDSLPMQAPDARGLSLTSFETISNTGDEKKTALHTWRKSSGPSNFRSVDGDAYDPDFIRGYIPQVLPHTNGLMMPVGSQQNLGSNNAMMQGMVSPFQMGQMIGPGFGAFSSWAVTPQQHYAMPFPAIPGQPLAYPATHQPLEEMQQTMNRRQEQ